MKKILIVLLLFTLGKAVSPAVPDRLDSWYRGYREKYFNNALPEKIYINRDLHDDRFMAVTDYDFQNSFYIISFNKKYLPSTKQERETLLHESCHIFLTWNGQDEDDQHGARWQNCMHKLADKGAFEDLW